MQSSSSSPLRWLLFVVVAVQLACSTAAIAIEETTEERQLQVDADAGLGTADIIRKRGYEVEEHSVVTADRYVLTMYRLPKSYEESQSNSPPNGSSKPVVILQHGLLDSSYTYVNNFRQQSLAFLLADAGYDVWLGNNRGTTWSQKHLDFSTKDDRFWDFSWQHMAEFDFPAMIAYTLKVTNRPTLSYVGHSEGNMQAWAAFSTNQELAKRVTFFGALAPVTYVGNVQSPVFRPLAMTYIDQIFLKLGVKVFSPHNKFIQDIVGKTGCSLKLIDDVCDLIINGFTGQSSFLNNSRIHVYVTQTPSSTSVKNVVHFAQMIRDNTYRRYDFGCKCPASSWLLCPKWDCKNRDMYGTETPPVYDLGNVHYPRAGLFIGSADSLATLKDVNRLKTELPKGTVVFEKTVPFNHLDFTWSPNAKEMIYDDLLAQMQKYEGVAYDQQHPKNDVDSMPTN